MCKRSRVRIGAGATVQRLLFLVALTPNLSAFAMGSSRAAFISLATPRKEPQVLGLGLAAIRDVVAFFHYAAKDGDGAPNPLAGAVRFTTGEGARSLVIYCAPSSTWGSMKMRNGGAFSMGPCPRLRRGRRRSISGSRFPEGQVAYTNQEVTALSGGATGPTQYAIKKRQACSTGAQRRRPVR